MRGTRKGVPRRDYWSSSMRFAQISDIHVPDFEGVTARDFMNKRITGALNLLTGRRGSHPGRAGRR